VLEVFKYFKDRKLHSSTDAAPAKPPVLERLEPRILLSGDGLLNIAPPDLLQDTAQVVQHAELLETEEQMLGADHGIYQELDASSTFQTDLYQPVLTFSLDDTPATGDGEHLDSDEILDDVGPPQAGEYIAGVADDSTGDTETGASLTDAIETSFDFEETDGPAFPTHDGSMPIYVNDADLSIEYATSIEIRGPPVGETVNSEATNAPSDDEESSASLWVFRASAEQNDLTLRFKNADSAVVELLDNSTGEVLGNWLATDVHALHIIGSNVADDTLTVDLSSAEPSGFEVLYWGGEGGYDSLVVEGTSSFSADYTAIGADSGTIELTNQSVAITISFAGLEPVEVYNLTDYTFTTTGGADIITIDSPAPGQNRITGTSGGIEFEAVTFWNITNFTLDTGANDLPGDDADSITIDTPGLIATGLATFTIITGDGHDTVAVVPSATTAITVDGGAGWDVLTVVPVEGRTAFVENTILLQGMQPVDYTSETEEAKLQGSEHTVTDDASSLDPGISLLEHEFFSTDSFHVGYPYVRDVALGELNGDDNLDVVTVSYSIYSSEMCVSFGDGQGGFSGGWTYALEYRPSTIALGDLNGDGIVDIVVGNHSNLSVFLGYGDGSFEGPTTITAGAGLRGVVLRDVNGDNIQDIIAANQGEDVVSVLLGYGDGTFALRTTYAVGDGPSYLLLADLDNDGVSDIVTAGGADSITVLLGNGDGTFGTPVISAIREPGEIALGDLNEDGALDIVSLGSGAVRVFSGRGDGSFDLKAIFNTGLYGNWPRIDDFTGDGHLDLAIAYGGQVLVLLGTGDGTFPVAVVCTVDNPHGIATGDLNNDGRIDLVTGNYSSTTGWVLLNQRPPLWHNARRIMVESTSAVEGVQIHFPVEMDTTSFSLADDVVSFFGPVGTVSANDFVWVDSRTLEVNFDAQIHLGQYEIIIGPDILDASGQLMDVDQDAVFGEVPDDQYVAHFNVLPSPRWSLSLPAMGEPVLAEDGTLYITNRTYDAQNYTYHSQVFAVNPEDGTLKWLYRFNDQERPSGALSVARDGTLYVLGRYGTLYAMNPDGTLKWQVDAVEHPAYLWPYEYEASCDSLAIGHDGAIYLLEKYRLELPDPYGSYVYELGSRIYAVSPEGVLLWSVEINDDYLNDPVVGDNGLIYAVGNEGGNIYAIGPDGVLRWSSSLPDTDWRAAPSLGEDGTIYGQVYTPEGFALQSVDPNGVPKWSIQLDGHSGARPAIGPDGTIYVTLYRSSGYAIQAIDTNGISKWVFETDYPRNRGGSWWDIGTPAIGADGTVYVATYENRVLAINPDGSLKWSRDVPGRLIRNCSPIIAEDGTVYVWSNKILYALSSQSGGPADTGWPMAGRDAQRTSMIPALVTHIPMGPLQGPVDAIRLIFRYDMDQTSFSITDDLENFTGPLGSLTASGYNWIDAQTLDIVFPTQSTLGEYSVTLGPNVLGASGNPMDLDRDGATGETPDDQYVASFVIVAPQILGHAPSGYISGLVSSVTFNFDQDMDETSFSIADDIVQFNGPLGPVMVNSYVWMGPRSLNVQFEAQTVVGEYEIVLGPNLLNSTSYPIDQDRDMIAGESDDDLYTATFHVARSPHGLFPLETFPVGDQPWYMSAGDFNNDDIPDIVVATARDDTVWVLLGRGDGGFDEAKGYSVGFGPVSTALGDLNGDGTLDIAVANSDDDSISVLLGYGEGTFAGHMTYAVGESPYDVSMGDLNGDDILDIVTVNLDDGEVSILLGYGNGTFADQQTYPAGEGAWFVALGDLNGDNYLDIVTAGESEDEISVLLGYGDGAFASRTTYQIGNNPYVVTVADLDNDGVLDIITANYDDDAVSVLMGLGDGTFADQVVYAVGSEPTDVAVGDLNGDGILDVVTPNWNDMSVSVLLGEGDGTFAEQTIHRIGSDPWSVVVADLNRDGVLDLAVANDTSQADSIIVAIGLGDGTFATPDTYATEDRPEQVVLDDLNGDGILDAVTTHYGYPDRIISVLLGGADGTFAQQQTTYAVGRYLSSIATGDLNGDGVSDIVTTDSYDDTVSVLFGNGDGTFAGQTTFAVGDNPTAFALGDLDEDGDLDIAIGTQSGICVLLNSGEGTFDDMTEYPAGSGIGSVVLDDLNMDGILDIVTANEYSNDVSVLLGNGDGTFAQQATYMVGDMPESLASGDLNGDGNPDLATVSSADGTLSLLFGIGDGTFRDADSLRLRGMWSSDYGYYRHYYLLLDDLDFDGNLDIVVGHEESEVQVLLGNGDGTFGSPVFYDIGPDNWGIGLGDLNGDGAPDLVAINRYDDTISVLINRVGIPYSPWGIVAGPVDTLRYNFQEAMDTSSFSAEDDIASFNGPFGSVDILSHAWLDQWTLELYFEPQTEIGQYTIVIGPDILNRNGDPMDYDRDGVPGKIPDDQHVASFTIRAPRILGSTPIGVVDAPVDAIRVFFNHDMDPGSFLMRDDIVSFTGPSGPVVITDYYWSDSHTLELMFEPQGTAGTYEFVIGPGIEDISGNFLDQDGDFTPGEVTDDTFTAAFVIEAPQIVSHTPSELTGMADSISLTFDRDMDKSSFSLINDIVSFTGPEGSVTVTGYEWLDARTLKINFDRPTVGGTYEMVLGPDILDLMGNSMDQDRDLVPGEIPDDLYTASFEFFDTYHYSGPITEDTIWNYQVVVLDGTITVNSGVKLTIEKGVVVKAAQNAGIQVQGILEVLGTPEQPVVLTSLKDDSAGGDTNGDGTNSQPSRVDWPGISFSNPSVFSTLDHSEVRYAYTAIAFGPNSRGTLNIRHSVLSNNSLVFRAGYYNLYDQLNAYNCLIIDNDTVIVAYSTAGVTLRNCTVTGNTTTGTVGRAILAIENSIFAFNQSGLRGWPLAGDVTIRNSDFFGAIGQVITWVGGVDAFRNAGNITEDPLFMDRIAGNYELAPGSPAIDSALGIGAPSTDMLGRPRYDDLGMPNVGSGYPSYVDIGAFERQQNTLATDLAVTQITNPSPQFLAPGESFTVQWTASNVGLLATEASWQDSIYLSTDTHISSNDTVLDSRIHDGILQPGQDYTKTYTGTAPQAVGTYYVLVRANAERSFIEPVEANNVLASPGVLAVSLPALSVDSPVTGTVSSGQWTYIRFLSPDQPVLLSLDTVPTTGTVGLYLRYGAPPTLDQWDMRTTQANSTDQELRIVEPGTTECYIGIYGGVSVPVGGSDFALSATLTNFGIRTVSPGEVSNAGEATLQIDGDNFDPQAQVRLIAPDGSEIAAEELYQNSATLFATFDLAAANAAPGLYDVLVINPGPASVIEEDAIEIVAPVLRQFRASLIMPSITRPGRVIDVRIDYWNPGTVDIPSPILTLDSGVADTEWQLPGRESWVVGPDFSVMGLSSSGPATILRPGQQESIIVRLRVPFRREPVTVNLSSVGAVPTDGSNTLIDWNKFEAEVRPEGIDDETWNPVLANLQAQIGGTWGDYATTLRENVDRWHAAGRRVYGLRELFGMELDRAYGLSTGIVAGSIIDADSGLTIGNVNVEGWIAIAGSYATAVAHEDGSFFLYGLSPGELELAVREHIVSGAQDFELPTGEDLLDVEILVREAGHFAGTIVADVDGQPVTNALVVAYGQTSEAITTASTSSDGTYEIGQLPADIYTIQVSIPGMIPQTVDIEIETGENYTGLDFSLVAGTTTAGQVTSASDGAPIEDAQILLTRNDGTFYGATTDDQGRYVIDSVQAGAYTIRASKDGYLSTEITNIDLPAGESKTINIALSLWASVSGYITSADGPPIAGTSVMSDGPDGRTTGSLADDNGYYEITGLGEGVHSMWAYFPGFFPMILEGIELQPGENLQDTNFELKELPSISQIVITTSPQTIIAGESTGMIIIQTQTADGIPLVVDTDTIVDLTSDSTGDYDFSSDGVDWGLTFVTVEAGSHTTSFYYRDVRAGMTTISAQSRGLTATTEVVVDTASADSLLYLSGNGQRGPPSSTLAEPLVVLVTDEFGNPVSNTTVTFTVTSGSAVLDPTVAVTDSAGEASTYVTFGPTKTEADKTVTVEASSDGLIGSPVIFTVIDAETIIIAGFTIFGEITDLQNGNRDVDGSITLPASTGVAIIEDLIIDENNNIISGGIISFSSSITLAGGFQVNVGVSSLESEGISVTGEIVLAIPPATADLVVIFTITPSSITNIKGKVTVDVKLPFGNVVAATLEFAEDKIIGSGEISLEGLGTSIEATIEVSSSFDIKVVHVGLTVESFRIGNFQAGASATYSETSGFSLAVDLSAPNVSFGATGTVDTQGRITELSVNVGVMIPIGPLFLTDVGGAVGFNWETGTATEKLTGTLAPDPTASTIRAEVEIWISTDLRIGGTGNIIAFDFEFASVGFKISSQGFKGSGKLNIPGDGEANLEIRIDSNGIYAHGTANIHILDNPELGLASADITLTNELLEIRGRLKLKGSYGVPSFSVDYEIVCEGYLQIQFNGQIRGFLSGRAKFQLRKGLINVTVRAIGSIVFSNSVGSGRVTGTALGITVAADVTIDQSGSDATFKIQDPKPKVIVDPNSGEYEVSEPIDVWVTVQDNHLDPDAVSASLQAGGWNIDHASEILVAASRTLIYSSPGKRTVSVAIQDISGQTGYARATYVIKCKEDDCDPEPPGEDQDSDTTGVLTSGSPEDKWGPAGYDAPDTPVESLMHFIPADQEMNYRIEMWNKPDAPVPTQDATIYDYLDPEVFDLSTFEFTRVGFLKWDRPLPGGQSIDTRIDCRPDMNIAVDITGTLDPSTGRIDWWFHTLDPLTGEYPEDPFAGFLPPFNPETGYEIGWMEFTVELKPGLSTGTQVSNQALVQFDFMGPWGPAPKESPWINTIDAGAPASQVEALPANVNSPEFTVRWSGEDDVGGSGIANYDVYVSADGSPFVLWEDRTTKTQAVFFGEYDHTYAFYSVAHDNVGHVEAVPQMMDTQTYVNMRPVVTVGPSQILSEGQMVTVDGSFVDDDLGDSWTVTVNYGDGGGPQLLDLYGNTFSLSHRYTDNGSYRVVVAVTDRHDASGIGMFRATVNNVAPQFEVGPDETLLPTQAGVFGRAGIPFTDPGADVWSGMVNFGDGVGDQPLTIDQINRSFELNHVYAEGGMFIVTVTIEDDDSGSHTDSFQIEVIFNRPPAAEAGGPYTVAEGGSILLDASGTTDPDLPGDVLTYEWDFDGDGQYDDATGINPVFSAALLDGPDSTPIGLRVTDSYGESNTDPAIVQVNNVAPNVVVDNVIVTVDEGQVAVNNGTYSDPGYDIVTLAVSLGTIIDNGDGTWSWLFETNDGPDQSQEVIVTATDDDGAETTTTFDLVVKNVAPSLTGATFEIVENSQNGTVVGTISGSDPGNDTLTYSIAGGTGALAFTIDGSSGQITVSDATQLDYETIPSFTLEIQVEDDDNATDTATVAIDLLNQANITGVVFVDVNENGAYDANEPGIDGITIELLNENGVPVLDSQNNPITATTSDGGFYLFEDLNPGAYQLHEVQPTGVDDGEEILGSLDGTIPANDTMQLTLARIDATDYIFAELGQSVTSGDTATIGFWQNKHGQALITQGGSALADWLTDNFANIFGNVFVGAGGDDVASFYRDQLFRQKSEKSAGPAKVDAQFMAVALATYFTSSNLAGNVATEYGFNVTDTGIGTKVVNVGDSGDAFGVADGTDLTIMQLLWATNDLTDQPDNLSGFARIYDFDGDGEIDEAEALLRTLANEVYSTINEQGGI